MSSSPPDTATEGASAPSADWPKVLEWIEKQGQESLKARFATAELIGKEAQTTLTVLLAGVGGTAAYAAKLFEPVPAGQATIAAAVVCCYLIGLSVLLVCTCMLFQSFPALYQNPKNLLQPEHTLEELREAELLNIEDRIAEATLLNNSRALKLNAIRIAASISPIIFVFAAWYAPSPPAPAPEKLTVACKAEQAASAIAMTIRCEGSK